MEQNKAVGQAVLHLARTAFGTEEAGKGAIEDLKANPTLAAHGLHDAAVTRKLATIKEDVDKALAIALDKASNIKEPEKKNEAVSAAEAEARATMKSQRKNHTGLRSQLAPHPQEQSLVTRLGLL